MIRVVATVTILLNLTAPAGSMETAMRQIKGPIAADVLRVLDGDTVEVRAYPWPQQSVDVLVRLRGIDAPEIHSKCEAERARAEIARDRLSGMVAGQKHVLLTDIGGDKYFGRIVANLGLQDGEDAASTLILENLVQPYDGGRKDHPFCQ
ncbi:thermonuclease family protein [Rhizobium sp. C4]|uniref:thermonuclease family protein n=1 Tax=Rhizobium sp. C4 TaxID=1349800 RepID=UPI001E29C67A|nr:thermonuclease family protein [Rhizobium sp. C4]MCD2174710.1 thermonuclease family protein [Rhizobium sp. C4]